MTTCAVAAETVATGRPVPTGATLRRLPWRAVVVAVFAALAATELVLAWPYVSRALSRLADPDLGWLSLAVVAELVSMQAYASVQQRMLAAGGRRMSTCRMAALTYAANAVNATLPGGSALSAGYAFRRLRTWGASVPGAAFTLVASGLLSTTSFALLVLACIVLAGSGAISAVPVLITVAALAVVAVLVHGHGLTDVLTRSARGVLRRYNRARHRAPDSGLDAAHRLVGPADEPYTSEVVLTAARGHLSPSLRGRVGYPWVDSDR
jgi:uncharacterized membrane protein YbhN (UPF0104 family)